MNWSLRARLLLLFALATAPIAAVSIVAVLRAEAEGRQAVVAASVADAVWTRDLVGARLETLAGQLGERPAFEPGASCAETLAAAARATALPPGSLTVVDAGGRTLCGSLLAGLPALRAARPYAILGLAPAGPPGLVAAFALAGGSGAIVATIPLAAIRLPAGADGWVSDGASTLPLAQTASARAPAPSLGPVADGVVGAARRGGATYGVASLGRLRLLVLPNVGRPGSRSGLALRVMVLVALLGTCLTATAYGIRRLVVAPIERIDRSVERWRRGGRFDPGPMRHMPRELNRLADTFGQATTTLAAHELAVARARQQQDLLMQEIHHRVKNNLQIVASMLNLQASRIRQPEAREAFQSARDRIRALATLHRHLYAYGELQTINMRSFLTELCGQLLSALGEVAGERITLDIDAPELTLSSDQAVPLSLIVTETVSNAVKFAFPDGRSGCIWVRLAVEGETARLEVRDDGLGIAAAAERPSDGIGLRLIHGFARQLGATLQMTEEGGTRYVLVMPLRHERADEIADQAVRT